MVNRIFEEGRIVWINIVFDTNFDFCRSSYKVNYNDFQIEIVRGRDLYAHNLYIETTKKKYGAAIDSVFEFLSELSWLFQTKVVIFKFWTATPNKVGKWTQEIMYRRVLNGIDLIGYKQITFSNEQKLALGIYREGISSDSHFYSFLSYFKIINIIYHKGLDQATWINRNIQNVPDKQNVINYLTNQKIVNIGDHLYESGRCAIAHASMQSGKDIANPNNYDDNNRILRELPLIRELAELFIAKELKIPTRFETVTQRKMAAKRHVKS